MIGSEQDLVNPGSRLCLFTSVIYLYRYWWVKNGKPFEYSVYDKRITKQDGRGTLVITSPQAEDTGQ